MLILVASTLALADEPVKRTASVTERTVLLEQRWAGEPVAFAVGPCTREACPLSIARGPADRRTWVTVFDDSGASTPADTFTFTVDGGEANVDYSEYDQNIYTWSPYAEIAGHPTWQLHLQGGPEHVTDGYVLVSLIDDVLWPIWTDHPTPRYHGPNGFGLVTVGGKQVLVHQQTVGIEYDHPEHQSVRRTLYVWDGGGLTSTDEVEAPWWLLIAATTDTAAEAAAKRDAERCLSDFDLLTTADYPRLTQGKTVLARVVSSQAAAEALKTEAWSCSWEPYIKRGK